MTVSWLLEELRRRDIQVWADGDLLRCNAPAGGLTAELRNALRTRKSEILRFLRSAKALAQQQRAIVPLRPRGTRTPVFAAAGHNGDVFCYRAMAHHLGDDQPFFGLQPPGVDGQVEPLTTVEDLAAYYVSQIREFRPDGPYILAGYCAGGTIAFELARQLVRDGATVEFLALFASPCPGWYRFLPQLQHHLAQEMERVSIHARVLASLPHSERRSYIGEKLHARKARRETKRLATPDPLLILRAKIERATIRAVRRYKPQHFPGRLILFLPSRRWLRYRSALVQWRSIGQAIEVHCGPDGCPDDHMLLEPYVPITAERFRRCCDNREEEIKESRNSNPQPAGERA